jgi:hypothetical protein
MIESFLNNPTGVGANLGSLMATEMNRAPGACSIEWYDVTGHLAGMPSGSPFRVDTFTLAGAEGGGSLPPGCCILIAYRADYGTDIEHAPGTRPRARDRGRIYFGPIANAALAASYGGQWLSSTVGIAQNAINSLMAVQNSGLPNQFNLVVWSRAGAFVKEAKFWNVHSTSSYQRRRADELLTRVEAWTPRS